MGLLLIQGILYINKNDNIHKNKVQDPNCRKTSLINNEKWKD